MQVACDVGIRLADFPRCRHAACRRSFSWTFIPSLPVLGAYVVAVLVITFTPGPDMTLFLGKAVRQGRAAGMAAMLGASTGILIHTTLVALGLSALLAASATAFFILKVVGALYLLLARDRCDPQRLGAQPRRGASRSRRRAAVPHLAEGARRQSAQPEGHHVLRDVPAAIRRRRRSERGAESSSSSASSSW